MEAKRLAVLALLLAAATPARGQDPDTAARTGAVSGIVRDQAGLPVSGATISLEGTPLLTSTTPDGRYIIARIPVGAYRIEARKIGYRPTTGTIRITPDTLLTANIRIKRIPTELSTVRVEAEAETNVSGIVMDSAGRPLAGVVVEALGQTVRTTSDSSGRFLLAGFKPGIYLVQWRKPGYAIAQYGVTLEARQQQRFNVRLGDADPRLITSAELAEVVQQEATRRMGMRGAMAVIVGREELARFGNVALLTALAQSTGALALRDTRISCLLVDGHEPLSGDLGRGLDPSTVSRRGPTSLNPAGTATRTAPAGGGGIPGGRWLIHFRADEVEMVEIYPPDTEHSRTLCGRFPPSSGCSCPPEPSGVVIWLRK